MRGTTVTQLKGFIIENESECLELMCESHGYSLKD